MFLLLVNLMTSPCYRIKPSARILCAVILLCLGMFCATPAGAQNLVSTEMDPLVVQEIQYANILKGWGMPDLSLVVLGRIKDPAAKVKIKVLELENLIYVGKWEEVRARIAAVPDQAGQEALALKLALADGYYAWGKYDEAQKLYDEFLSKFPDGPPDALKEFFLNSAYKYAQMLILMGNKLGAVSTYEKLVLTKPEKAVERQIKGEMAELMVTLLEQPDAKIPDRDAFRKKLDKVVGDLFWLQDLWFAKAIVLRAHLQIMDGQIDKAMQIIDDYRPQLEEMDQILKDEEEKTGQPMTKLSPMAECRYLLGTVLKAEADKIIAAGGNKEKVKELLVGRKIKREKLEYRTDGALQHFIKVFIQYPNTPWAPDAGNEAKNLQTLLETDFGAKIDIDVGPEQWAKVEKAQFTEARSLFNQNQFEPAIKAYVKVLNLFPESETGVSALAELARCFVEMKDDIMFDVTSHYIAERFGRNRRYFTKAGDEVLKLAGFMDQLKLPEKHDDLMTVYFSKCPGHPAVPVMIMKRADKKLEAKDYEGAASDYQLVEDNYADSIVYESALNKRSICLFELDRKIEGIKTLTKFIGMLEKKPTPDTALLSSKFRLAQMYRKLDKKYIPTAFKYYKEVVDLMEDKANPAHETLNKDETNRELYEAAIFYQGVCYVSLDQPPQNVKAYRLQAIKFFDDLVGRYPKSKFGPQCLLQVGTLYTVLENSDKAGEYLKRLEKEYPDSEEAANSKFLYANALMDMGKTKEAGKVFAEMFKGDGKYSEKQILAAGVALLDQKRYEIALQAFEKLRNSKDEGMAQRVLIGLGECYYETGSRDKAVEILEEMLKKFPNTGHTPLAATIMSKAYGDLAMDESDSSKRFKLFNEAVKSEKTVRKYQTAEDDQKLSDLRVGRILKKKAAAEEKFGDAEKAREYKGKAAASLQTIIMFTDAKNTVLSKVIEDAYAESIPLLLDLEMWREAFDSCEKYVADFPQGKYVVEVRSWRNKANVRLATMGDAGAPEEESTVQDLVPIDMDEGENASESPQEEPGNPAGEVPVAEE